MFVSPSDVAVAIAIAIVIAENTPPQSISPGVTARADSMYPVVTMEAGKHLEGVPLRLASDPKSVSKALSSHSDRTLSESVRMENLVIFQ